MKALPQSEGGNALVIRDGNPDVILPDKHRIDPAWFQRGGQPQPIHITIMNAPTPPPAAIAAPVVPPTPPAAKEEPVVKKQNPLLRYWKLILVLVLLLLVAAAVVHFAKKSTGETPLTSEQQRNRELEEEIASLKRDAIENPAPPSAPAPMAPMAPTQVESYGNNAQPAAVTHQRGGAVVSNVQEIDTPDGSKWLLLYGPNGGSVSYPASKNRSAQSISTNMSWKVAKPKAGRLEIFDTVPGQNGQSMHIYAWKLR